MCTRYPILPVHELAMRDALFLKSWGRINRILLIQGYTVYKRNLDAMGSVETNVTRLREEIGSIRAETSSDKVNIIAPSKGGLDAKYKYMIRHLDMAGSVASLHPVPPSPGPPHFLLHSALPGIRGEVRRLLGGYRLPRSGGLGGTMKQLILSFIKSIIRFTNPPMTDR